ncbi:MAG: histidinol-phosphate transaminase [Chloroflexi bacterium]|nr:histidinol-phosphate transaminase [Chloroflexota bacterium]
MALQVRPHIANIQPGTHGGINFCAPAKRGASSKEILDFSTCCNPYGPPRSVQGALAKSDIALYPDPDCQEFIGLLSGKIGAPKENLIATSGSTELLRLAALAYTGPGDTVVIPSPTYGEYELACKIANARTVKYEMRESSGFRLAVEDFIALARKCRPSAIFLCNPNNPTGQYLGFSDITKIVSSFPATLIVLDEAYVSFSGEAWDSLRLLHHPNILIVRSMTKDFALAGLRLGYGIACKEIINTLKKLRPPWNVNSAAQQAGIAALGSYGYIRKCNTLIHKCKNYLISQLESLDYRVIATDTNFFLVCVGNATDFQSRLLARGFLVRDCSSFGLPGYVRIAPRRMQDCRSLIAAIRSMRSSGK